MSSHREAPSIAKDPVADNTDVYAFVSPDDPSTVTIIANFIPLEEPGGGPNFYEFGNDVLYEIVIDQTGDGNANIIYQFLFETEVRNDNIFLYNTGPIRSLSDANWNRPQFYTVRRVVDYSNGMEPSVTTLGTHVPCPPCNIGPVSIPNYPALASAAIYAPAAAPGTKIFAGQRAEGFYVDLGAIFNLGDLRPFQEVWLGGGSATPGVNSGAGKNVHTIAIQVPKTQLLQGNYSGSSPTDPRSTIGVWARSLRQKVTLESGGITQTVGPYSQISRLGNPLVNEVLIGMGFKDSWNSRMPQDDSQFAADYEHPALASLLPTLYPDVFPNLAALNKSGASRADIVAILLTGLPAGVVTGFQNYTGSTQSDLLRLNVAYAPSSNPSLLGLLGGDVAGFPNGRRVFDDVTTIELRALAGLTYALVDKSYTPDKAAGEIYPVIDPATNTPASLSSIGVTYLSSFPYLGTPYDGFDTPAKTTTDYGTGS